MSKTSEETVISPSIIREQWLSPEFAVREVVAFECRFGAKHLMLACHAALPLILTPELVNLIRINFLEASQIPWVAEMDFLLSSLCREIDEGVYEVEPSIRDVLLVELENQFGWERPFALAKFLEFYLAHKSGFTLRDRLIQTQRWIAKAYLDPDSFIEEMTNYLELEADLSVSNEIQAVTILEILAAPLELTNKQAEYRYLVEQFRELAEILYGDEDIQDIQKHRLQNQQQQNSQNKLSDIITDIYNTLDPFEPLLAGDPAYVDCREVRGNEDIIVLGQKIRRSRRMTCQLYAGHRGTGKSTELLRLKQYLENQKFFVVYFAADHEDVDAEDTQYTDILLACTRHLLEDLKDYSKPDPLLNWLGDRWQQLKELAQTEVTFEGLTVEAQISQFSKLTANLRAVPSLRHKIRSVVKPQIPTLIDVLNQFIAEAKNQLSPEQNRLALIVDNLDRIVPAIQEGDRTNHEEIFLDRSEQLRALDCHVVYTVPISMVYSKRASDLREIYGNPQILPTIMVQTPAGDIYQPGFDKIKEVIARRVAGVSPTSSLETDIFDRPDTLEKLCLTSGGHVRNLLLLLQVAIDYIEDLPISGEAVERAITDARDTYRRTVDNDQWNLLAEVSVSKQIRDDDRYRILLLNRCVLEYRYFSEAMEKQCWYDVQPLIKEIPEF